MGHSRTHSDAPRLDRHDRTRLEFGSVTIEDHDASRRQLGSRQDRQPDNPGMSLFSHHCQLTEIFVERDENPTLLIGQGENLVIAGISRPVSRPDDIVPRRLQRSHGHTGDAAIKQQFHEADSRGSGSIRS